MNERESTILEKLAAGEYDGFCPPARSYGSVKRGGAVETGVYIEGDQLIEYKDVTYKFFDGKENERTTESTTRVIDSDWEKLEVLQKIGYKMYDHPEVREYSKDYYNERDRIVASVAGQDSPIAVSSVAESDWAVETAPICDAQVDSTHPTSDFELEYSTPTDEKELSAGDIGKIVVVAAAVAGAIYGVVKLAPHAKKWWTESAAPSVKKTWRKITHQEDEPELYAENGENNERPPVDEEAEGRSNGME